MKKHNIARKGKKALSMLLVALMVLSCWVWVDPSQSLVASAAETIKDKYLFAYFTDNSSEGQTVHLAVSEDGLHYTALRNNEPVIIPSKGTGAVRDPYLWYNEQDNYYYLIATDMDASGNVWWDNCNGFIMWRSKDLVHWYDEMFINVYDLLVQLGKEPGTVHRAWAPQILWDGTSYVVYFSIDTDNVNLPADQLSIVYFRTTDLMDLDSYYEYNGLFYPGSDVNDAEIIQHPTNGKWYLFYKPEGDENNVAKIRMMVSDNATGPYASPVSDTAGLDIFPGIDEALEGGNGYFDNDGNFVMYADAYGHGSSYFYISKTDADGDFSNWTVYGEDAHNINSLSPRHGSVVKITETEYNRLLNSTNAISSSSFPADETLSDHLIARYFTTSDLTYNAANGKNDLAVYGNMTSSEAKGYYQANFDGTDDYAEVKLSTLVDENFNYDDGFTITFTATSTATTAEPYGRNSRIYEIADIFGKRSGKEHYTHFAVAGDNGGAYIGNYGPNTNNNGYGVEGRASKQLSDGMTHEYIVSYANGNTIVYCDGQLIIKMNRFDGSNLDNSWYEAISSACTMRIGKSGWVADPLFQGSIQDLCIYDCSMSYYDVQAVQEELIAELGWVDSENYTGITSKIPTFTNANESQMSSENTKYNKYTPSEHYSNILYTTKVDGTPSNSENPSTSNAAVYGALNNGQGGATLNFGIFYPTTTVLLYDGITEAKMPIMMGGNIDDNKRAAWMDYVYPLEDGSQTAENNDLKLKHYWNGWTASDKYHETVQNPDGDEYKVGYSPTVTNKGMIQDDQTSDVHYFANTLAVSDNINFNGAYYKEYSQLGWLVHGCYEDDPQTTHTLYAHNGTIYVINLKPLLEYRDTITEAEYNSVMNNADVPQQVKNKYAAAVYGIKTFDINSYDFTTNATDVTVKCANDIAEAVDTYEDITEMIENPSEVRYENLFSFNGWVASANNRMENNGTINVDKLAGTITLYNPNENNSEAYSAISYGAKTDGYFYAPVTGGETYVLEYTATGDYPGEVFFFEYLSDGTAIYNNVAADKNSGTFSRAVKLNANTVAVAFRFDANKKGTITYSDIGFYTSTTYNLFAAYTQTARQIYFPGYAEELLTPDCSYGCNFDGWLKDKNDADSKVSNTLDFSANSEVVYASWNGKLPGYEVVYDSLFSLSGWASSSCNMLYYRDEAGERLVDWSGAGVSTDIEAGTITIVNDEDPNNFARTNYFVDNEDVYQMKLEPNVDYVLEYTASTTDGGKQNVCLYITGGASQYPETGTRTSYSMGTHYIEFNSGDNTQLALRFDNVEHGTTVTYSNIAVYKAEGPQAETTVKQGEAQFDLEAARSITNRQYKRAYDISGTQPIGDVFEYIPERPGYTFDTWITDGVTVGDGILDYDCVNLKPVESTFAVDQNWHLYSTWIENSYTIKYNANGGSGSVSSTNQLYTADVTLPDSNALTKSGYALIGWSPVQDATVATYQTGQTVNRLTGENNGTVTLYAVWAKNEFTVKFDGNGSTSGSMELQTIGYSEATELNSNAFERAGYEFKGWSEAANGDVKYTDGASIKVDNALTNNALTLYAVWEINDSALVEDTVVVDFGITTEVAPLENDTIFAEAGSEQKLVGFSENGTDYKASLNTAYGTLTSNNNVATFIPTAPINSVISVYYHASVVINGEENVIKNKLTISPASNVYYEEDVISPGESTGKVAWEVDSGNAVAGESNGVYGNDDRYSSSTEFSNDSNYKVSVDSVNKRSESAKFTFTGTGFDLIAACGSNTGVQLVNVRQEVDGKLKLIKGYIVDTYYDTTEENPIVSGDGLIYQTPIVNWSGDYGTYTVDITSYYLSTSGALQKSSIKNNLIDTGLVMNSAQAENSADVQAILDDAGIEGVSAKDVELVWFDDNSVLNGGTGASATAKASRAVDDNGNLVLDNYIDGIRVYNALGDDSSYYSETEKNAVYANVVESLIAPGDEVGGVAYINGGADNGLTWAEYQKKGPKGEIYLTSNNSLGFKVTVNPDERVMIALRAVNGATEFTIGSGANTVVVPVNSKTEMYYDITECLGEITAKGTEIAITVTNSGDALLAINHIKFSGGDGTSGNGGIIPRLLSRTLNIDVEETGDRFLPLTDEDIAEAQVNLSREAVPGVVEYGVVKPVVEDETPENPGDGNEGTEGETPENPGDNTTGDGTTGDDTTGDNTTGDDTTGDNTTGDNTTGDDTTGDGTTGDGTTNDDTNTDSGDSEEFSIFSLLELLISLIEKILHNAFGTGSLI